MQPTAETFTKLHDRRITNSPIHVHIYAHARAHSTANHFQPFRSVNGTHLFIMSNVISPAFKIV